MYSILSIATTITLLTSLFVCVKWGRVQCRGVIPASLLTFCAILFTSGLDVGLIMFPLVEFPVYASEAEYSFANPLAIEFGFWGFLVWVFYFLTTFYFCVVEPKVRLFEIKAVKLVNSLVIIATCAFTGYLFLDAVENYIEGINALQKYSLVGLIVLFAVYSSSHIRYVKLLSIASTLLFVLLGLLLFLDSGSSLGGFLSTASGINEYFSNIHHFFTPVSDYHGWYLFWWFSWSIMVGQFVARFVPPMAAWQLLVALLIIPSIALALWFTTLYYYFVNEIDVAPMLNLAMVAVGILFVANSLDSLIRLYTDNLEMGVKRLGLVRYLLAHWALIFGLVLLYQFTPMQIEWVGLVVIGLYSVVYVLLFRRRKQFSIASASS
ncbi:MAG: choline transporter [SAR86 cluster bacterium]|uniref:Choline transporter n=1 Tax=SAR86 cluster bacterium TaxID=2030880 RepID=A0A2A4MS71_9GAMM|nr:MAG: choline transporter [SAR86 cluster bacterium]